MLSDGGCEVDGEFVVSCGDAPEVLQAGEHPLDRVPLSGGDWIEGMALLAGGIVGDDRQGSAVRQELS